MFDGFKEVSRVSLNDKFLGDEGAARLAEFLDSHGKVEALEIKSNDIGPEGFQLIFQALKASPIRYLVAEYNNLGMSFEGVEELCKLIRDSNRLEYLNFGSNKIEDGSLELLSPSISSSPSLKLIELKFNGLTTKSVQRLVAELKRANNRTLLFVDLSGNKIDRATYDDLEDILKGNRKLNPIPRQKLMTINVRQLNATSGSSALPQQPRFGTGTLNNTGMGFGTMDLTSDNLMRHLEGVVDQGRRETAEMKIRLEKELEDLQRREKFDARELIDLDAKCNQLVLFNRNLKFELDRCISEKQQVEREHSHQIRSHEDKVREANKDLAELQAKYQDIDDRMSKEHLMRMKELGRDWQNKLRALEDRIRMVEIENNDIENDIRKAFEKRERIRVEAIDEENSVTIRVEEEEANRYNMRLAALESKLGEITEARQLYLKRNNDIVVEMQQIEDKNAEEISTLEAEIDDLKQKEELFIKNNREFISNNEKLGGEIRLKEMTFQKLEVEINSLNQQIELKKKFNKDQVGKILEEQAYENRKYHQDKEQQVSKLHELQKVLRASQIENTRLRQEYISLAETVQMNVNRAIENVFVSNNLY